MTTVRIFFEKCGESAYISLLDLQRVFHRLLKISGLPVWYTQGFNPHIYLSFSCPLSLGQESLCESCEVKTEQEHIDGEAWRAALQPLMPRGITVTKVAPAQAKVGEIATAAYHITMPAASAAALDAYNAAATSAAHRLYCGRGGTGVRHPAALRFGRGAQPQPGAADGLPARAGRRAGVAVPGTAHPPVHGFRAGFCLKPRLLRTFFAKIRKKPLQSARACATIVRQYARIALFFCALFSKKQG